MERPAYYGLIDPKFNPGNKLEWNEGAFHRLAEKARLKSRITITGMRETNYHPNRERRLLSLSDWETSNTILEKVFPDCLPTLPLPSTASAATTVFDPESGSTIALNHQLIEQKATIANPNNPDQGYISLLDDLTYRALRNIIRQEKMQTIGVILSKSLSESRKLAFNLSVNAAGCAFGLYGIYRLGEIIGNPNLSLTERIASGIPAGGLFFISIVLETIIFAFTADTVKTSYQTLRGYGKELSDNLADSLTATRELYLKHPYLVRWK